MEISTTKVIQGQITATINIDKPELDQERENAIDHLIKEVTVKGFRKGSAPRSIAQKQIDEQELSNHILYHLLDKVIKDIVTKEKIRLLGKPTLTSLKPDEKENWTLTVTLPVYPTIDLKDYQKLLKAKPKSKKVKEDKSKIEILLEKINIEIADSAIQEEVDYAIQNLANQAKKLNLSLEKYLEALNKNLDEIKKEYFEAAKQNIKSDLLLIEIARKEKIDTPIEEIKQLADKNGIPDNQILSLKQMLDRRKTLDFIENLG